ncbi:MAG: hypothetical protein L3J09_05135 [Flavobacteriaceae bacterium]|nr:hypothetical protein [Flavobacteriaceae bacterium]
MQAIICIFAEVKILAFILSIYILALNFTPCEDSSVFDNSSNTELAQLQDFNHDHNALDLCSPFCHCQCCQVHAEGIGMIDFTTLTTEISSEVFFHFDNLGKDIPKSILQPPRV